MKYVYCAKYSASRASLSQTNRQCHARLDSVRCSATNLNGFFFAYNEPQKIADGPAISAEKTDSPDQSPMARFQCHKQHLKPAPQPSTSTQHLNPQPQPSISTSTRHLSIFRRYFFKLFCQAMLTSSGGRIKRPQTYIVPPSDRNVASCLLQILCLSSRVAFSFCYHFLAKSFRL